MFYGSLLVTTKQKPMVDIKKIDRKKSKHATTENHPITKKPSNQEERDRTITKQPKHQNKMAKWNMKSILAKIVFIF